LRRLLIIPVIAALLTAAQPGWAITLKDLSATKGLDASLVFGAASFAVANPAAFPQWARVLGELETDMARLRGCLTGTCPDARWRGWRDLVRKAGNLAGRAQLATVNRYFNAWPYKKDRAIYGRNERWAAPRDFLPKSGDCEDYAIAKYATLKLLGIPDERLRIVVIYDRIRAVRHAVVTVETGSGRLVLDSLSDHLFRDSDYAHYEPRYSVNARGQWTHARLPSGGES
jgi:predicted transglutaminase-like cysteine proteinase